MVKTYSKTYSLGRRLFVLCTAFFIAMGLAACGGGGGVAVGGGGGNAQATVAQGTITGFGSIFVNGVEFSTNGAQVTINNAAGQASSLRLGQRVTVTGQRSGTTGTATRIDYNPELEGQITAIDPANSQFTVLGQTVAVTGTTVYRNVTDFTALAVGNFVEVSGRRDSAGVIVASYVEARTAAVELEVHGVIASLDTSARTFRIGPQLVNYANATLSPSTLALQNGLRVEVGGALAGGTLNATRVSADDDRLPAGQGDASLEGVVRQILSSTQFVVGSTTVQISPSTRIINGAITDIALNVEVEVEGSVDANGVLQATSIRVEHASQIRVTADIQSINSANRTVTVLGGITVAVSDRTRIQDKRNNVQPFGFTNLVVGDHVEVAAALINGQLTATRLERVAASSTVELRAPVTSSDPILFTLLLQGVTVNLTNAQFRDANENPLTLSAFLAAATPGVVVNIRGTFDSLRLNATRAELESPDED